MLLLLLLPSVFFGLYTLNECLKKFLQIIFCHLLRSLLDKLRYEFEVPYLVCIHYDWAYNLLHNQVKISR